MEDTAPEWFLGLLTSGTDVTYHEDPERLVLEQLRPMGRPHLDPLQFAYQPWIGVEDTIIYLLNRVFTHLDKPGAL